MKALEKFRKEITDRYLAHQRLNRLVQHDDFEIAWKEFTEEDFKTLDTLVQDMLEEELKEFIRLRIKDNGTPFEQMSITKLRTVGKNLRIPRYNYLRKVDLLHEIQDKIREVKESTLRVALKSKELREGN